MALLPKPTHNTNGTPGSGCLGCPFAGDMTGFVPDLIRRASVCVVAQNPGSEEEAGNPRHEPLVGKTGMLMDRVFLPLAGLTRDDVSVANSLRCRWNHKNELPPLNSKALQEAMVHCQRAHWKPPEGVKLYVAMGEYAVAAITQQTHDFSGWRGYLLPYALLGGSRVPQTTVWNPHVSLGIPVLATYHLAYLWREPEAELPAKRDWNKIPQILDGKWPESMPKIETDPNAVRWMPGSAWDTEFVPETGELIRFSLATPDRRIYVIEAQDMIRCRGGSRENLQRVLSQAGQVVPVHAVPQTQDPQLQDGAMSRVLSQEVLVMGQAALSRETSMRASPNLSREVVSRLSSKGSQEAGIHSQALEDWADLYPIQGYGHVPRWAMLDMSSESPTSSRPRSSQWPSAGPALLTMQPGFGGMGRQPLVPQIGTTIPLKIVGHHAVVDIPYLSWLLPPGTLVNVDCSLYAHASLWTGAVDPDETKTGKSGGAMSHKLNFLGSLYSRINRWKHLSKVAPITYSGGDAIGTMDVWETGLHGGIRGELERDPQSKWVYENLQKPLVPIIVKMRSKGIAVDQKAADAALKDIVASQREHVLQAQAYVGWGINLRSPKHLAHWLFDVEGIKLKRKPFSGLRK